MTNNALLYYTHFVSDEVRSQINNIVDEISADFRFFAMGCCDEAGTLEGLASDKVTSKSYLREELKELPYECQLKRVDWETMRFSTDLAIMQFFRGNPDFDYYWIIEYDVRFTGRWGELMADLSKSNADLLCSYVTSFIHGPDWMHWDSFVSGDEIVDERNRYRAFLPFARVSNRLMNAIDERCRRGWAGHYEVLWPTIAKALGGSIEEIGGVGAWVPAGRHGRYYYYHDVNVKNATSDASLFLSTFAAWPSYSVKSVFSQNSPSGILWHPVKE